jgi:beta-glucosidase
LLWRGLTSVFASLLVVLLVGTSVTAQYGALISQYLGAQTYEIVDGGSGVEDTEYYKSSYGEVSDETVELLIRDVEQQVINEEEEGAVLLKNDDDVLPLDVTQGSRVTLFGRASADPLYTGSGSQSMIIERAPEYATTPYEAFTAAGFSINQELHDAYAASSTKRDMGKAGMQGETTGKVDIGEERASFYTDELKSSWAEDYNDVAVVILSRYGGEGVDLNTSVTDDDGTLISQLSLFESERDLLRMIQDSGQFGKVVVLLNSAYQMEVDWFDEYGVDAALWIAFPGLTGFTGVVNLLTGAANPSGRLPDTYATSSLSAPALANSIDNTSEWANVDEVLAYVEPADAPAREGYSHYSVQLENIYVGYKYYETRYEDAILGQGNADSASGTIDGGAWDYADEMSYPFGYGLSYTTFTQELDGVRYDAATDLYTAEVTVTNTGGVAGKSAVQVYAQTPYGDYERENGVEKASVNLVGFGKTQELEPGASETVTVEVDRYLLASYDDNNAKGYILSEGEYYLAIGDDAHDALNNVLAAKGCSGLVDQDGDSVTGDVGKVYHFAMDSLDTESYRLSESGTVVTNRFDDADINNLDTTKVTYLSRSDWEATFPTQAPSIVATEWMMRILNNEIYTKPADAPSVDSFTQGVDSGISFVMMRDVPYDDPAWETYIDQFTLEEMAVNATDNFGVPSAPKVAMPETAIGDGTNGFRGLYSYGEERYSVQFASSGILAAAFNKDLARERARLFAEESLFSGSSFEAALGVRITFGTNIGSNLHRSPFGGRAGEYLAEDANLTALMGEVMADEYTARGYAGGPKHFAGNDQETHRGGLSQFLTEQSFRENSLRAFEGPLGWGDSMYTMQGMGRIGVTYVSANWALNTQVLRNEWGFVGFVETDAAVGEYSNEEFLSQLTAGSESVCLSLFLDLDADTNVSRPGNQYIAAIEAGDGFILQSLRELVHRVHYTLAHTSTVNGLSDAAQMVLVTPWWRTALYWVDGVAVALAVGCLALLVCSEFWGRRNKNQMVEEPK